MLEFKQWHYNELEIFYSCNSLISNANNNKNVHTRDCSKLETTGRLILKEIILEQKTKLNNFRPYIKKVINVSVK